VVPNHFEGPAVYCARARVHRPSVFPGDGLEVAEGDHAVVGVEQLRAGGQRDQPLAMLLLAFGFTGVGIVRKRVDYPSLGEVDDQVMAASVEDVGKDPVPDLDDHLVTGLQLKHPAQGLTVSDAVSGNGVVAGTTRIGGVFEPAASTSSLVPSSTGTGRHSPHQTRGSSPGPSPGLPRHQPRYPRACVRSLGPSTLERRDDALLLAVRDPVGPPQLPADAAEQNQPGDNQALLTLRGWLSAPERAHAVRCLGSWLV